MRLFPKSPRLVVVVVAVLAVGVVVVGGGGGGVVVVVVVVVVVCALLCVLPLLWRKYVRKVTSGEVLGVLLYSPAVEVLFHTRYGCSEISPIGRRGWVFFWSPRGVVCYLMLGTRYDGSAYLGHHEYSQYERRQRNRTAQSLGVLHVVRYPKR